MGLGIRGIGLALPATKVTAEELAASSGVPLAFFRKNLRLREKPVAREQHPLDLALEAIGDLQRQAPFEPSSIDLIVYASTGLTDYLFWSPAAKVQATIGATNAYCFEVSNACNSLNLALHVVEGLMATTPSYRRALIVCADTLSRYVDHADPESRSILNFADAASALLCDRDAPRLRLVRTVLATDSAYVDAYRLSWGGSRALGSVNARQSIQYTRVEHPESLHDQYTRHITSLVERLLHETNLGREDIDFLFMNQGDHRLVTETLGRFGLREEQSCSSYETHGHLGTTDIAFALRRGLDRGLFEPDANIIAVSSAVGFSWGASLFKF
ncbi:3-oxoacyl-ACP synthase III family protein [Archangium sp.]|uniref:3-oxoacyl-ACP synthase III family protein n=1 Tax=Archangium sp. TaxID=1872627 RepID=UPI002D687C27|nr:3-oxoacyl-[acyl-carrier-protein] synthase III C-terminal domain-containing protein [Archangium sp.]HYO56254.1 3-oxoacyl-[acyl-carrier-protein] synthase III C-terminal domain-containing protein [Archangium sp.]